MRPDGTLENFDELASIQLDPKRYAASQANSYQRHSGSPIAADLPRFFDMVVDGLKLWQSHFILDPADPWIICFTNLRTVREGMKIENLTQNAQYLVENVQKDDNNQPTGVVWLTGQTPPKRGDRLKILDDVYVRFHPEYVSTEALSTEFDRTFGDGTGAWIDTITYRVSRREPGTTGPTPFGEPREIKPRFRTQFIDPLDSGYQVQLFGQRFDNLVQFDCWSKTPKEAQELADWFFEFIQAFTWVFKWNGLSEIFFWQQSISPELVTRHRNNILNVTLQFYVRTEAIQDRFVRRFNTAVINLGLAGTGTIGPVQIPTDPTGQIIIVTVNDFVQPTGQ